MRVPRNLSGPRLARTLRKLGYEKTRQTGSHIRLTTQENGEHHVTIPHQNPLRVGTLSAILGDVAQHFEISRDELMRKLF